MNPRSGQAVAVLLFMGLVAVTRLPLVERQPLWADEIFSLAIATGHSLEHPAAEADSSLGDFIEWPGPMPAWSWQRYLAHDTPSAGFGRVFRAVLLSDTSPPLYYLLLNLWTRLTGTGDAALRLFSLFWALASVPLLWSLARRLADSRAAVAATIAYAFAPASLYYSTEGRMYSLLWCLALALVWLTLRLHERGPSFGRQALWLLCSAAGFLTHYFFVFPWSAAVLWLGLFPGRASRRGLVALVAIALMLVLPWYLRVPESLARWRVTGHWLEGSLSARQAVLAPFALAWDLIAPRGVWGGPGLADRAAQVLMVLLGLGLVLRGPGPLFSTRWSLVWLWLAAACTGPLVFDLLRGTLTSLVPRYALAGLPAAVLLLGVGLSRLPIRVGATLLVLLLIAWAPGVHAVLTRYSRSWEPYRHAARAAAGWAGPSGLVIVHSIPSGVLGIARYLPPDVPVAAWVGQLGRRKVPADISELVRGRARVAFVRIHEVGEPAPEEEWLHRHARLAARKNRQNSVVLYFEPSTGELFDTRR